MISRSIRRGTATAIKSVSSGISFRNISSGSLLLRCADSLGIVSTVSDVVTGNGWNVTSADVHVERTKLNPVATGSLDGADTFLCRFSFAREDNVSPKEVELFEKSLCSSVSSLRECRSDLLFDSGRHVSLSCGRSPSIVRHFGKCRVGLLLSKREHCLTHLLDRARWGDLDIDVSYVISNAYRPPSHPIRRYLDDANIPYHYVSTSEDSGEGSWEKEVRDIVARSPTVDVLVLARFMRVLSPSFLKWRPLDSIVNIHHGLLPSFKGANPYRQAYNEGVKLVGATAHFVTEDLDEGPILEQAVDVTTHGDTIRDIRIRSEALECGALERALRFVTENRVAVVGRRTVIFR
uniref:Formyl transferase N-terminal domain-containing protein n=1 Tax=Corethron hystrix TaxID=216773 RepID=A0A7S1BMS6_9STRA|mmetsp:Transcript_34635/g.80071  ORF Transcript_34635/g.80071 Transcript_34635/m.80071 type:complete len:350 (+) Transcript_34635:25-1074(+)